MRAAYASREFRPIWLDGDSAPAARSFIARLEDSREDGLAPESYSAPVLRQRVANLADASRSERIRTELLLTSAYAAFVHDLHTPASTADLIYTDPALQPAYREPAGVVAHLAEATSVGAALKQSFHMNEFYLKMRAALARHRQAQPADKELERVLLVNLDRLRALPGDLGERFVLVDAASNKLWLYEDEKSVDTMKVIVGTEAGQTPQLAALIRYSMFNPYWNVPPDITRDAYAPQIAANSARLAALDMDPWSNFTSHAVKLDPRKIDWPAIAEGRTAGWLRQRPGPNNSMGAVKFMLPNKFGIYLHDTPERELFDRDERFFSSGCVRVEDAQRLSRWLYRGFEHHAEGDVPEQRLDLPSPMPVYIIYLTVTTTGGKITRQRDAYGRDPMVVAELQAPSRQTPQIPVG